MVRNPGRLRTALKTSKTSSIGDDVFVVMPNHRASPDAAQQSNKLQIILSRVSLNCNDDDNDDNNINYNCSSYFRSTEVMLRPTRRLSSS